ncbi:hypothetical protein [Kitasatospora sp. MBT63]|uniref:GP88 family protein n=1 Tax=Kitasatospora sp. MBT63 TaxID=1444768 RepID=UPI0007C7C106|nr:hypothetical protein [Kitasatospora sp. MBT63]
MMAARKFMLTQNSQLRRIGVYNFTLPAEEVTLPDGREVNVCPSASACISLCYARAGAYRFSNVLAAHTRTLEFVMDHPDEWEAAMIEELAHKRYFGKSVRLHDSGDFYSADYLKRWLRIMETAPDVLFYTYTKEVVMFRRHVEGKAPANFRWRYSLGGKHDRLLDLALDPHAEVFPTEDAVAAAGYVSNTPSDLVAAGEAIQVGMPANNIKHLQKLQGDRTFGEIQRAIDAEKSLVRAAKRANLGLTS